MFGLSRFHLPLLGLSRRPLSSARVYRIHQRERESSKSWNSKGERFGSSATGSWCRREEKKNVIGWAQSMSSETTQSGGNGSAVREEARKVVGEADDKLKTKEIDLSEAWWVANVSGADEDFKKKEAAQNALDDVLSNPILFSKLTKVSAERASIEAEDPLLWRQIQVLRLQCLEKQLSPDLLRAMSSVSCEVEQAFNVYRATVDGKELSDGDVRRILKSSTDSQERKKVWEANKGVGSVVVDRLKKLIRLRNDAARVLGHSNYHELMLSINEQDSLSLFAMFDRLDELTREPFRKAKSEMDSLLARQCGIDPSELMPWHYHDPFFQECPAVFEGDLDLAFAKADIENICRQFYAGIGLSIDSVLKRSDLYEKPGKCPHAFCTDVNRQGDVRVLANIVPNEYWMSTMLHELGHAAYSTNQGNIPATLPRLLRTEAHILTTEGIAMLFEKFAKSIEWMNGVGLAPENPKVFVKTAAVTLRNRLLIFSRWCQVMLRFEAKMYANPDQDLNSLWWDLVEKYQEMKRPLGRDMPDFASKIHICSAPVYYHNYMLGELFASQLHHTICKSVLGGADPRSASYIGNPAVGKFLCERVFSRGRSLPWDALTEFATGAPLSPDAFARDCAALDAKPSNY